MDTTVSNPVAMMQKLIPHLLRMLDEAGVQLPLEDSRAMVTGVFAGLLASLLPGVVPNVGGETAAAVHAARLALQFRGTAAHEAAHHLTNSLRCCRDARICSLESHHVRDWSARTPVRM